MRDHILTILNQIEKEYEVKILYACDAGSRAMGFASKDSDYDIRFIYVHKKDWYLSIDQYRDTIEISKQKALSVFVDSQLDVVGWELTKTLRLFRKSNPSLLEWLNSEYVYCYTSSLAEKLKLMQNTVISEKAYINHHLNLAKRNFNEMKGKDKWREKVYLYVLRSILSAKWIQIQQDIPPVGFSELLSILEDAPVKSEITELLSRKQSGKNYSTEKNLILNEFIAQEILLLSNYAKLLITTGSDPTKDLNEIFRVTLKEAWE